MTLHYTSRNDGAKPVRLVSFVPSPVPGFEPNWILAETEHGEIIHVHRDRVTMGDDL